MATDISQDESLEELVARAKRSERETQAVLQRFHASQRDAWEKLVGPAVVDQMLQSRTAAEGFLADKDSKRRLVSLSVLIHHWKPDRNLAVVAEKLAFDDPDPEVREVALLAVGAYYATTADKRISALLAEATSDTTRPERLRKAAYLALFQVSNLPIQSWPDATSCRFPEDVDWEFVRKAIGPQR